MATRSFTKTSNGVIAGGQAYGHARPDYFIAVSRWELRRALASRATWVAAALTLGACFLSLRFSSQSLDWFLECCPQRPDADLLPSWTTLWGLACALPGPLLIVGLFVPFVAADGVACDLTRRTHELVMTTPVPTWAYVLGRYIASILLCLVLAGMLLLAICVTAVAQHVLEPGIHSWPNLPGIVAVWAVIVLPPTIVLGSVSFFLGTVLPRRSSMIKLGVLLAWFTAGVMLPQYMQYLAQTQNARDWLAAPWYAAYVRWDPASSTLQPELKGQFFHLLGPTLRDPTLSNRAFTQRVLPVVRQAPDLGLFIGPHLAWIGIGVGAAAAAVLAFHRFRNAVG